MDNDISIYIITALLPLSALMLVLQVNPYHALVIRGILGAISALVYAVLGAADVALTEALMGTMLAVTLYVVAVRSSMVMRLGMLSHETKEDQDFQQLVANLRSIVTKYYLRLELVPHTNHYALEQALINKEVHGTCIKLKDQQPAYQTTIRIQRLYEIMESQLSEQDTLLLREKGERENRDNKDKGDKGDKEDKDRLAGNVNK